MVRTEDCGVGVGVEALMRRSVCFDYILWCQRRSRVAKQLMRAL